MPASPRHHRRADGPVGPRRRGGDHGLRSAARTWRVRRRSSKGCWRRPNAPTPGLPDLKVFICGGASVSPSLIRRAAAYFERAVVTRVYGSTEVPVTTVGSPTDPEHAADTDGRPAIATVKLIGQRRRPAGSGEMYARGPQMLVGYRNPEDDRDAFDDEGYLPHRRSRAVGRRRLPGGDRPREGHHHPQRREHRTEGDRGHPRRAPRRRRDLHRRTSRTRAPESARAPSSCPRPRPAPTSTAFAYFLADYGVATFKAPEQVVIWDSLPKNDAGKVLKHQIRAALTKVDG